MTEQEAINDLKMSLRIWGRKPQKESYEMAISALEKQIPKKIKSEYLTRYGNITCYEGYICPNCKKDITDDDYEVVYDYCPECGQALKWGEDDDA